MTPPASPDRSIDLTQAVEAERRREARRAELRFRRRLFTRLAISSRGELARLDLG